MNLNKFNREDTTVVITSFPNPKDGSTGNKGFNAVGWHSRKTLTRLSRYNPVLVLAEKRKGSDKQKLSDSLTIARVWEKGNIFSIIGLIPLILKLNKTKSIFVQFEFNVFGGILPNLALLFTLLILRLAGKKVTFELHQVITDIGLLQKHVPVSRPMRIFFNLSLRFFYVVLGLIASEIIVFEQMLKNRLKHYIRSKKINVLSLSVEPKRVIDKEKARRKLKLNSDEFIVMVFGFINGYKGIDWMVENLADKSAGNNMRLLVAGGANPYLIDKPYYQKFYNGVVNEVKKHNHMTYAGFIPDDMVDYYFAACDVVVLPYEVFMSASGPFSLALSYKKPVILSEKLKSYSQSEDFVDALVESGLSTNDLFFPLTQSALLSRLYKLQKKVNYRKYVAFSSILAHKRSSESVVRKLHNILYPAPVISIPAAKIHPAKA